MGNRTAMNRVLLVFLLAALGACGALWWMCHDLRGRNADLGEQLRAAYALQAEIAALKADSAGVQGDLRGLLECLREEGQGGATPSAPSEEESISLSALQRMAGLVVEQNKELAGKLTAAEARVTQLSTQLASLQGDFNRTSGELTKVNKSLDEKSKEAQGLQTKLTDLEKAHAADTGELAKVREQLAAVITERVKLAADKKKLEEHVKEMTDADSEQTNTIAALSRQVKDAEKETADLKGEVKQARQEADALKQAVAKLTKQIEEMKKAE